MTGNREELVTFAVHCAVRGSIATMPFADLIEALAHSKSVQIVLSDSGICIGEGGHLKDGSLSLPFKWQEDSERALVPLVDAARSAVGGCIREFEPDPTRPAGKPDRATKRLRQAIVSGPANVMIGNEVCAWADAMPSRQPPPTSRPPAENSIEATWEGETTLIIDDGGRRILPTDSTQNADVRPGDRILVEPGIHKVLVVMSDGFTSQGELRIPVPDDRSNQS